MDVSAVQESLARCTVRGGFTARFLALLAEGDATLARALVGGDPAEQRRVARRGLQLMILYAQGAPMAATLLDRAADEGAAGGSGGNVLAVHPDLHPYWVDTLMRVVGELDPGFGPALEKRWREVLGAALAYLAARPRGG
jgi:hypothetical protein